MAEHEFFYYDADSDSQTAVEQGLAEAIKAWESRVERAGAEWRNAAVFVLDIQEVHMLRDALAGWEGRRQVAMREQFAVYVDEARKHGVYDS